MSRSTALRVVGSKRKPLPHGDPSLTRDAIAGWGQGQRRCRARKRHNWGPDRVFVHRMYYEVVERCSHCRNRRWAPFSKQGRQTARWKPLYREGYLLPKGAAPIEDDDRDQLVLADILARRLIEAQDDEETG